MIVGGNIDASPSIRRRARADRRDPGYQRAGVGGSGLVRTSCRIAPCAYGMIVLKDARASASKLAQFILGGEGQAILVKHGFGRGDAVK